MLIFRCFFKFLDSLSKFQCKWRYKNYKYNYNIDESFCFNGPNIIIYGKGEIKCGSDSYIGRYSSIQLSENNKVIIGKNVSISHFVNIYTFNHKADKDFSSQERERACVWGVENGRRNY